MCSQTLKHIIRNMQEPIRAHQAKNNKKQPSKKHMVHYPAQAQVKNLCLYEQKGLINLHGQ